MANLGAGSAEDILNRVGEYREQGITFVFSTHDPRVVTHASRVVTLVDGRVAADQIKASGTLSGGTADLEED